MQFLQHITLNVQYKVNTKQTKYTGQCNNAQDGVKQSTDADRKMTQILRLADGTLA